MTRRRTIVIAGALCVAGAIALLTWQQTTPLQTSRAAEARPSPALQDDAAPGRVETTAVARLRKADVRPAMKSIAPRLRRCYDEALVGDPQLRGVINTKLTLRNEPGVAMTLVVNGFDTDGTLGESQEFLACARETFEEAKLPPIATRGSLEMMYPSTFAREPLNEREIGIVDVAAKAADAGRWSEGLAAAERGLRLTSLDGPYRRRLIEVAGISACHLGDESKARRYYLLASPGIEDRLQQTCLEVARLDPSADREQ